MANKYIGQAPFKSTKKNIDFALMYMYCLIPVYFCNIIRRYDICINTVSKNAVRTRTSAKGWFD